MKQKTLAKKAVPRMRFHQKKHFCKSGKTAALELSPVVH